MVSFTIDLSAPWKKLKSVNDLRKLYFLTVHTSAIDHKLPYYPRFLNKIYANFFGYFWLPCHVCNSHYGGHESYGSDNTKMQSICPQCTLKAYNETKSFDI